MSTQRHDSELAERLHSPSSASMTKYLPDMGQALAAACTDLSRDPTIARCDEMLHRLQSAGHAVSRLRWALAAEGGS